MTLDRDRASACETMTSASRVKGGETVIYCYRNQVPSFVGTELDALYASLYSSRVQLAASGALDAASTYLARRAGRIVAIFLFRREKRTVHVINEVIRIDAEEIEQFAKYIFSTFSSITMISFRAIETDLRRLSLPFQRINYLEDIVVVLPKTIADYRACLGRATRRTMRRHLGRLRQDFPSFHYQVLDGAQVEEAMVRQILDLKKARMALKNWVSNLDQQKTREIIDRVKACGRVSIVTIDGRVCAGAISYQVGNNYFFCLLAHDPAYDRYGLGVACCYLMICDCIERHGREFHFLWGRYEYKYQLLGVQRNLDNLTIYRSRLQWILNGDTVLKNAFNGYIRLAQLWLQHTRQQNKLMARLIINPALRLRNAARGRPHASGGPS